MVRKFAKQKKKMLKDSFRKRGLLGKEKRV
jgi:hypothetical protein